MKTIINYLRIILYKILPLFIIKSLYHLQIFLGYKKFKTKGVTDKNTFSTLINLYCLTNGDFIEKFSKKIRVSPINSLFPIKGIFGENNFEFFQDISNSIKEEGYFVLAEKLDKDSIDDLLFFAKNTKSFYPPYYNDPILFDEGSLKAEIYRFDSKDLINNYTIQKLIMDESLIQIARSYLDSEPIFDFPAMWWSTSYLKNASSEAAQLYHFDFDRVKWIKFFIYLTDVTPNNGPHCYISGTHKVGAKPLNILKRGYVRVEDSEMNDYYDHDQIKFLYGDAGSMFLGDTKCWHKGTPLKEGFRLVLELQYTSSLFGANIPKVSISQNDNPDFAEFCKLNAFYTQSIQIVK